jgi:hypothetical protein
MAASCSMTGANVGTTNGCIVPPEPPTGQQRFHRLESTHADLPLVRFQRVEALALAR